MTRYDDRWRWLVANVVPRFRRFDADPHLIDASLRRIFDEAQSHVLGPCSGSDPVTPIAQPWIGLGPVRSEVVL